MTPLESDNNWTQILLGRVMAVQIVDEDETTLVLTYSDGRRIIVSGDRSLAIAEEHVPKC